MVEKKKEGRERRETEMSYSQFRNFADSRVRIITSYNYFLRNQIRKESTSLQHWFSLLSLDVETFFLVF